MPNVPGVSSTLGQFCQAARTRFSAWLTRQLPSTKALWLAPARRAQTAKPGNWKSPEQ